MTREGQNLSTKGLYGLVVKSQYYDYRLDLNLDSALSLNLCVPHGRSVQNGDSNSVSVSKRLLYGVYESVYM